MSLINEKYKLNIYNDSRERYILSNKILAILFREFRDKSENNERFKLSDKQQLLKKFESVIKCLRMEILGVDELYKKQEDNIELLIELSDTVDIKEQISQLCKLYKKLIIDNSEFEIIVETDLVELLEIERKRIWPEDLNIIIKDEKKSKDIAD